METAIEIASQYTDDLEKQQRLASEILYYVHKCVMQERKRISECFQNLFMLQTEESLTNEHLFNNLLALQEKGQRSMKEPPCKSL